MIRVAADGYPYKMDPLKQDERVRQLFTPTSWDRHHIKIEILAEGIDACRNREWILTNGLGGYCSQTVSGENTRKEHALLVGLTSSYEKRIYVKDISEIIRFEGRDVRLDSLDMDVTFESGLDVVRYVYKAQEFEVVKDISLVEGRNALFISYEVRNNSPLTISHQVSFTPSGPGSKRLGENRFILETEKGSVIYYSSTGDIVAIKDASDYCFDFKIHSGGRKNYSIVVVGDESLVNAESSLKKVWESSKPSSSGIMGDTFASELMSLLHTTKSFIISVEGKKTIVAGYHDPPFSTRETLIALPGVCFLNNQSDTAEKILELTLNNVWSARVPSSLADKKEFNEFDAGLWLIDRVGKYIDSVGIDEGMCFLHTYWWSLKDVFNRYLKEERDGILMHKSGTWISDSRENAIEVQGLWYNSMNIMVELSLMMGEKLSLENHLADSKKAFDELFWNGSYFRDCKGDEALRPSQVIVFSLKHNPVENVCAVKALSVIERNLLTDVGLRTLSKTDPDYCSSRENQVQGNVFPWLLGPFASAYVKYFRDVGRKNMRNILQGLFEKTTNQGCLGSISQYYSVEETIQARGNPSHTLSVCEPVRAYFEDILMKKF